MCHRRSTTLDITFLIVVFLPVATIGYGLGLLVIVVGAVGTAVYSLSRRGRGPTPGKVFQAVYGHARPLLEFPAKLWRSYQ